MYPHTTTTGLPGNKKFDDPYSDCCGRAIVEIDECDFCSGCGQLCFEQER